MSFLKTLRKEDPSSPVAYHLEGLLEATERIRWHLAYLDAAVDLDTEELAGRMVDLQVEIFDHMSYHMKELRRPFARLIAKAYRDLERLEREQAGKIKMRAETGAVTKERAKAKSSKKMDKGRSGSSRPVTTRSKK